MSAPALTSDQNILPVQAYFNIDGSFNTFIGQGHPFVVSATESIGINNVTTNATFYPVFSPVSSGQVTSLDVFTGLTYNPSTGLLTTTALQGNLKGIADLATNLVGSYTNALVYQSTNNTTSFIANGTTGQYLSANTSGAPTWVTPTFAGSTVTDDTSTNATRYPLFSSITSGNLLTEYTSSTKYQFNPNTGALTATSFVGSGASLTSIPNGALVNSSITVGTISISLGSSSTTLAGLSSVTSTSFVGALTGNASSATTATSATVALNVQVTDSTSSSSTFYPTLSPGTTGSTNYALNTSSTKLSFVPNTGTLTATNFSGLASSATNIAGGVANQIIYQTGAGATSFITAPSSSGTYLEWNGSAFVWATPGGGGTVTSVAQSFTGGLISVSGSPITSSGTLALTVAGISGGIPYFSSGTTWASSGALSQYSLLVGGGAGNAPTSLSSTGTANQVLISNGSSANPSFTSALTGLTIDNTVIGATIASTGKFTTLEATGTSTLGDASTTYIQVVGDASYPAIKAAGGTNTPLVLQPLGTGALQAQKTDSTATGGNARGANAVDWQTSRASATQVASGTSGVVGGGYSNTAASSYSAVAGGASNYCGGSSYNFVGGGYSNTVSGVNAYSSVVGGILNTASGYYNFIGGGYTNSGTSGSAVTTQATSTITSGSTAVTLSGTNASIKVGQLITGTPLASQTYVAAISGTSLTLSQNATSSTNATLSFYTPHGVVVAGGNNQATGSYSFIGGGGDAGTAANRNTASGDWSSILGGKSAITRGVIGAQAYASGEFSAQGDAQTGIYTLRNTSTSATLVVLTADSGTAGTLNQAVIPSNYAYTFRALITGRNTSTNDTASYQILGSIQNTSGTVALVGTPSVTTIGYTASASTWVVSATADNTNKAISINATGAASTTIHWVCKLETIEVG